MVTTGARAPQNTNRAAPLDVAYWVQFRRGDYRGGPAYTGTYGFDWVEWTRNSANNPTTAYDDLTAVMGKPIGDYVQCYDPGLPGIPAQAATATSPAIPAKPAILPQYAAVAGLYKQRYEEELHKGYTKLIVQGNDHYVPWLSLRPHQTVQLKLEVEFLNQNPVQPTNLFTVVTHPDYLVTIAGKTNAAPMQLVPKNKQVLDVTIECLRPSAAASLRVEDEHGNLVGQLNILENLFVYELPVRVVYVLLGVPMNPKDPPGKRPLYAPPGALALIQQPFEKLDFITYLNTHALNQALITCVLQPPPVSPIPTTVAPPYQLLIDQDQWKADGFLKGKVLQKPDEISEYCEKQVDAVYGSFRGITIFVHELDRPPETAGPVAASGVIRPMAAKTLTVFRKGLQVGKPSTLAHELGHVLGLTHTFPMGDENSTVADLTQVIEQLQAMVPPEQAKIAGMVKNAASPSTPVEQAAINQANQALTNLIKRISNLQNELRIYSSNPFKFNQSSTENLMDYDPGAAVSIRLSFWHWQWLLLQTELVTYYGTKTAAK
jgi:hypothetical protein